jgi:hypothetical protein
MTLYTAALNRPANVSEESFYPKYPDLTLSKVENAQFSDLIRRQVHGVGISLNEKTSHGAQVRALQTAGFPLVRNSDRLENAIKEGIRSSTELEVHDMHSGDLCYSGQIRLKTPWGSANGLLARVAFTCPRNQPGIQVVSFHPLLE